MLAMSNPTGVFCMFKNLSESLCAQVEGRLFFRLYSGDMKWISLSKTCLMPSKMKYGRVRHIVMCKYINILLHIQRNFFIF